MLTGIATDAEAARLTDEARIDAPASVAGGKAGWGYGAAYEHARRLQTHADRIDAMTRCATHWAVQAGEQAWRGLVHLPTWGLKPADDSPQAQQYRDHAAACLGIDGASPTGASWRHRVDETLTGALLGFALWETWAELVDGVPYAVAEARYQGSIVRWVVDARGRLVAAEQQPRSGFGNPVVIPMGQALHAVYQPVAPDDYSGVGLRRAVEPLYRDAVSFAASYAAGMQRWAVPTPHVTIDVDIAERCGQQTTADGWFEAELRKWSAVARDYVSHERAYLAPPPWVKITPFGGDVHELQAVQAAIDSTDRRILSVYYGQTLMLGTTNSGGSYSVADVQIRAAHDHAQALCEWVMGVWAPFIRRAVEWRFGPVPAELLPQLHADGLASEAFVDYLAQMTTLVSSDLLRSDDAVRDSVRRALELPAEDPANRPAPPRSAYRPGAVVMPTGGA